MMRIYEEGTVEVDGDELRCPMCGGQWMHHQSVLVASRAGEDGDYHPVFVTTGDGGCSVPRVGVEAHLPDPPCWTRRGSVYIEFRCELCGPVGYLAFEQQKGITYTKWYALTDEVRSTLKAIDDIRDALTCGTEIQPD